MTEEAEPPEIRRTCPHTACRRPVSEGRPHCANATCTWVRCRCGTTYDQASPAMDIPKPKAPPESKGKTHDQ